MEGAGNDQLISVKVGLALISPDISVNKQNTSDKERDRPVHFFRRFFRDFKRRRAALRYATPPPRWTAPPAVPFHSLQCCCVGNTALLFDELDSDFIRYS